MTRRATNYYILKSTIYFYQNYFILLYGEIRQFTGVVNFKIIKTTTLTILTPLQLVHRIAEVYTRSILYLSVYRIRTRNLSKCSNERYEDVIYPKLFTVALENVALPTYLLTTGITLLFINFECITHHICWPMIVVVVETTEDLSTMLDSLNRSR